MMLDNLVMMLENLVTMLENLDRAAGLVEAESPPRVERPRGSRRTHTFPGPRYTLEVCPEEEVYYPCPISVVLITSPN